MAAVRLVRNVLVLVVLVLILVAVALAGLVVALAATILGSQAAVAYLAFKLGYKSIMDGVEEWTKK